MNNRVSANYATRRLPDCGFTLIETMIVVTILAIIVTLAYPAYQDQVRKARRSGGMSALVELANRLEHYYVDRGSYAGATLGKGTANIYPAVTPGGYYTLQIDVQDKLQFAISAAPAAKGSQDRDRCGVFILDSLGNQSLKGNSIAHEQCWR